MSTAETHPTWWSPKHTSAWDRTKMAIRRDWEQTKHDISGGGHDLNQDAGETLRQASGKVTTPVGNVPNPPDAQDVSRHAKADAKAVLKEQKATKEDAAARVNLAKARADVEITAENAREKGWNQSESAVRYGFGAGMSPNGDWSASRLDLRNEWTTLNDERTWEDAEDDVRHGWEGARKANAQP